MNLQEKKMELAINLLKHALSRDRLKHFLVGVMPYHLETMDESRNRIHDTGAVMAALYTLDRGQPELAVARQFDQAMTLICSNCSLIDILDNAIHIILCHLTAQKENRAGFTVDCDRYIDCLRELAPILRQKIKSGKLENKGLLEMLSANNAILFREVGKSFL